MRNRARVRLLSSCLGVALVAGAVLAQTVQAQGKEMDAPRGAVVGTSQPITVDPDLENAIRVGNSLYWTRLVKVHSASFLKAHLVNVNLRVGDMLTVRSRTGNVVEEIVGRGPQDEGNFWALSVFGDEMYLEFQFVAPYTYTPFRIDQIIVGNADLLNSTSPSPESICSPGDFENVICYQSDAGKWANVMGSVGVMTVGGNPVSSLWCSGSNVSPLNYLLTNNHCITSQSDCNTSEFVFKYYTLACGGGATTQDWQGFRCNQLVAYSPFSSCDQGLSDLDFSLCSVIGDPASTYGYVSPDPVRLTDGEAIYIIQHPAGRPHEIAHGSGPDVDVDGTVLRYYDTLDTEGGSSGSPIYRESDDKLVGLHHCGGCSTAGVGNRGMLMADIYPHIAPYVCSPTLELRSAGYEGLAEVHGNGDAVFDPGETWQFSPKVQNSACSLTATSVTAAIQVNAGSVPATVLDPNASFGNIGGGLTVASTSPVRFQISAIAACGGNVILDVASINATNGGPFAGASAVLDEALGTSPVTTLFSENFSSGLSSWTIVNGGTGTGTASTWTTANPGGRSLALTAPFAIADSDALGSSDSMDEQLISPLVNCSGYLGVTLQFNHDFTWYSGGNDEQCDVAVRSTATAGSWVSVAHYSGGSASGAVAIDISSQAAGQTDLQVRFHYYNALYEWWWAVDDILVVAATVANCAEDFTLYGAGCVGSAGYTPSMDAVGSAAAGGAVVLDVTGGQPGSVGYLVLALAPNLGGGCLLLSSPLTPVPLPLNGSGEVSLPLEMPLTIVTGTHFYLQWVGLDSSGPPRSYSNGLDVLIP
ncbi:MAG: trypsin-like peptidase domain-containing protein [Planctomycetota bacterium]